jgi:hypothetical protein
MAYKLIVTHKPSGNKVEYGPWPGDPNPDVERGRLHFAQGFVLGTEFARLGEAYNVEEYEFEPLLVPDQPDEESMKAAVVGQFVATASASVTHPDGTVD